MKCAIGIAIVCALAACGEQRDDNNAGVDPPGGGGPGHPPPPPPSCAVRLVGPTTPSIASPVARIDVRADIGQTPGTLAYAWSVEQDGRPVAFTAQTADGSEIAFSVPDPGVYDVRLDVGGSVVRCPTSTLSLNVGVANADSAAYRIRVVPPPGVAMLPLDAIETIPGGATYQLGPLFAAGNPPRTLFVLGAGGGVPAYLRLTPEGPGAAVEAFADATGAATLMVPSGGFDVLVVPSVAGLAPHRFVGPQGTSLVLDDHTLAGAVTGPGGGPLAGARVQITAAGAPSSVATTAADGRFTVWSDAVAGDAVIVDVAPPAGSGLPRLSATARAPSAAMAIAYAPNLALRDLAGLVVVRDGVPLAGARVTLVGDSGAAGTIAQGATPAVATGAVLIATTADASGALPHTLVPTAALTAVIATGGDLAVVALDTAHAPASLDAPAPQQVPTQITVGGRPVAGAVVDFVPTGVLAQVAAPSVRAIADDAGLVSARLVRGGHYDVRVADPAGIGALTAIPDVAATALPSTIALTPAIQLRGSVLFTAPGSASAQPLAGAAVQVLCAACDGLAAGRPLAEGTTDLAGRFVLAIPDPNADPSAAAR